jgi:hypothetical protein
MRDAVRRATSSKSLPLIDGPIQTRETSTIDDFDGAPAIVSVSDIHGYYEAMYSALTAVGAVRDPVVREDSSGQLHWADSNYLLLFNGDLIDRGEDNKKVLRTALRLKQEAPPGRVRLHLGNHEMAIMLPEVLHWPQTYSGQLTRDARIAFLEQVCDSVWTAAFEGYNYTYSHAGRESEFDPTGVNARLRTCAGEVREEMAADQSSSLQAEVPEAYDTIFGLDGDGRGPDAGILWMDFYHMPQDAPPQIVGHSRHEDVTKKGNVICQNTIRSNLQSAGGESVVIETPSEVRAVTRDDAGTATTTTPVELF